MEFYHRIAREKRYADIAFPDVDAILVGNDFKNALLDLMPYGPMLDCIMFAKGIRLYCVVCREAVRRMIDFYTQ